MPGKPIEMPLIAGTKDELIAHVADFHVGEAHIRGRKKETKEYWIRWHERLHETGTAETPHIHRPPTPEEQAQEAIRLGKPLNSAQRTVMTQLINNDYGQVASQMRSFAHEQKEAVKAEIQQKWAAKNLSSASVERELNDLIKAFQQKFYEKVKKIRTQGLQITNGSIWTGEASYSFPRVLATGMEEEINTAMKQIEADLKHGLLTVEAQRLKSLRQVLLNSVDPEAHALLQTMPDARAMMLEAASQRTAINA